MSDPIPTTAPTRDERTAFVQQLAEDIADGMNCPEAAPCCDGCACWKEAETDV